MSQTELQFGPMPSFRNLATGRFMKGHIPANKGRKWSEWASKRSQRKMSKGWANLEKYRPSSRPDNAGRCRKPIIAVSDSGKWLYFEDSVAAASWSGGLRENIDRCCRFNASLRVNKKTGKINTDHKYKGVKWYFESDIAIWRFKIQNV